MGRPKFPLRDYEMVQFSWPDWYVKCYDAADRLWHYGPWKTQEACRLLINILRRKTATAAEKDGKLDT